MNGPLSVDFVLPKQEGRSKVMALQEAVARFVAPGDTVHAAYTGARPCAPLFELARCFRGQRPGLTLTGTGLAGPQAALVELDVFSHVVVSFVGANYPVSRPSPAFQRALAEGRVTVENWSLWGLIARLVAGALGVPFMPLRSIAGTTMATDLAPHGYVEMPSPFDDGRLTGVVSALRPDVVLLQAVAADEQGNVVLAPPYGEGQWGALAARKGVIACVEKIVTTDEIREHATLTTIPSHLVRAVCETPFGAHPYSLYNPGIRGVDSYVEDRQAMETADRSARRPEDYRAWIDEWLFAVGDHAGYVEKIGAERRAEVVRRAHPDFWREQLRETADDPSGPTHAEIHVVSAARYIERRITSEGHQAVLAGVGLANLAAWVGVIGAQQGGDEVELMAEIGMVGYAPRPGEPFVFAHRNYSTSKSLTDSMTVLGALVAGPATKSLGVFGAGQVDGRGDVNSTFAADGRFLVGSGGANDIAGGADEVIVVTSSGRGRTPATLPYVTSSGASVVCIATDLGIFERHGDRFVLTQLLPVTADAEPTTVDLVRQSIGWEFDVADDVETAAAPTPHELALLRAFDPYGVYTT